MSKKPFEIAPASGKLGVLLPGLGAVSSTFIAGVHAVLRGDSLPIGSVTQMGTVRLGKRTDHRAPLIKDLVPLSGMKDLVFGGWDIYEDNVYQAALKAGVLERTLVDSLKKELGAIRPMKAVFDRKYIKKIDGPNVKKGRTKMHLAEGLVEDMLEFKRAHRLSRLVTVWCASTEAFQKHARVHASLPAFEKGLKASDPNISPSQIYAYAALMAGSPYVNGSPNLSCDIPAILELARVKHLPIGGKDFKTGQTLMKTIIAPGLKARMLGLNGWFSTNILGNRDGEVLDDPASFKTKEESKLSVLDTILQPEVYPALYGNINHKVRIEYYPPRGDNKEGWDNIDIFGWLGYPMQIKINFLCRDSILAAPIVLDLALLFDLAHRARMSGIQEWLSFFFKSPMTNPGLPPEHDLFIQQTKLKNTLRHLAGEELITHLGWEYYKNDYESPT